MSSRLRPGLAGVMLILTAVAAPAGSAAAPPLNEATVHRLLPEVDVKAAPNEPSWLLLDTFREPHLKLTDTGFELVMDWNGIDDDQWPATRIVEVLAAEFCGPLPAGVMERHLDRLYDSKSLEPEIDLGGNAGTTFLKRHAGTLGACHLTLAAQGARWHTLSIAVDR
ncbi:MAG TPA: hypothetical protein VFY92_09785 [Hyphomicrobiaceae bacterium]|nr:hypothetical protein [Hyphomicrobiaceae bacterium]